MTEQHAYQTLNLEVGADMDSIKRAYRVLAKKLHPDRNPDKHAHEQFVELSLAYEHLIQLRTSSPGRKSSVRKRRPRSNANSEQEARERAQSHAQMRYAQYVKTDHYRNSLAQAVFVDFLTLLTSAFIILVIPVIAVKHLGITGIVLSVILIAFSAPLWYDILRKPAKYFDYNSIQSACARLIRLPNSQLHLLMLIQLVLLFRYTLPSLVPFWELMIVLVGTALVSYLIVSMSPWAKYRQPIGYGLTPLLIHLFFMLNFIGSHSPTTETYRATYAIPGSRQKSILLQLSPTAYEQYPYIRFFLNSKDLDRKKYIQYHFEEGLFGIKVMKDHTVGAP